MKRALVIGLMVLWLAPLAWPAGEIPKKGGSLILCVGDEPPGLDPTASASAAIDRVVYSNIFEGLVKTDRNGKLVPGLAAKWDVSADGKVYTFQLRKGVSFHNGEPFNAQVAKWNLERGGAEGTKNAHPEFFRAIEKIETPDEFTLKLTLKDVNSLFLVHMAEGDSVMLPMKGYENTAAEPIGTGPFKFVEWKRGDSVVMERNPKYWNPQLPYLDKVTYRFIKDPSAQVAALKSGDVDILGWILAPEIAKGISRDKRFKVLSGLSTSETVMSTNNKAKPFDNKLVRQAMAHAIDRKTVERPDHARLRHAHRLPLAADHPLLRGSDQEVPLRPQKGQRAAGQGRLPEWVRGDHQAARHLRLFPEGRRGDRRHVGPGRDQAQDRGRRMGVLAGPDLQAEGLPALDDRPRRGLGHRHLRQPELLLPI
jgi:ABC-type transport system substrate-binding protein